jgi:hypothetical protein
MFVGGRAAVNLMLYPMFKKLGKEYDELMKTNLTLNNVGQPDGGQRHRLHVAHRREQVARYLILRHQGGR